MPSDEDHRVSGLFLVSHHHDDEAAWHTLVSSESVSHALKLWLPTNLNLLDHDKCLQGITWMLALQLLWPTTSLNVYDSMLTTAFHLVSNHCCQSMLTLVKLAAVNVPICVLLTW